MKELALISQTTPAVVTFNYDEIDAQLDVTLKKYNGLVFTEDTAKECKKTITELKKGQKSLSDFRIKTKKLLTADITKFEDQCKKLSDKFNTVINPLGVQADDFEVTRIANKRAEIQTIIDVLIIDRDLNLKYYEPLIITDQMLNKGPTIKSITAELTNQADVLLSQQNMEKANIELIKSKVELANSQYGVTLLNNLYLGLLGDGKDVTSLIAMINENAEQTKIAAEEAKAEILAIEARKAERLVKIEAEKVADEARRVEKERLAKIARDIHEAQREREKESERASVIREKQKEETKAESLLKTGKSPFSEPQKVAVPMVATTETYKITGTEVELDALEKYLDTQAYKWELM
ncbi:DUF1351 domain-containing protein [Clostridium tagluense]|uniref:DUF1351 domain-containing protein n=1 Tax=Clostridium tagluense TaxID=360422 RepID=UPI001CF41068|nr:DUF1351 domain-containing protein [Clostridium tagluense]MCB2300442.1 DUF1351 domain-containing protein [Clostridium tagluense]